MSKMFLWDVDIICNNGEGQSGDERPISVAHVRQRQLIITKSTNPALLIKSLNIDQIEPLHHFKGSRVLIECEVTGVIDEGDLKTALNASLPEDEIPLAEERVHAYELAAQESSDVPDGGENQTIDQPPRLEYFTQRERQAGRETTPR